MKGLSLILMLIAGISFIMGLIYKVSMVSGNILPPCGLGPLSFQRFTNTCLLFAIGLGLLQLLEAKKK
jgi:hypothetical protein